MDEIAFTSHPKFQDKIEGRQYVYFYPANTSALKQSNQIKIPILDRGSLYAVHDSFLNIVGTFKKKAKTAATNSPSIINGGFLALFDSITYFLNGHEVDSSRFPYLTTWLKSLVSLPRQSFDEYQHCGFQNPNNSDVAPSAVFNESFSTTQKEDTIKFNVLLPLRFLLGCFEDHKICIVNQPQELVLQRSLSDVNILKGDADVSESSVELEKITWVVPSLKLSDHERSKYYDLIAKDPSLPIAFRSWSLVEFPLLPQSTHHIWSVQSTSSYGRPRTIVLAWYTGINNALNKSLAYNSSIDLTEIRLYLNETAFPATPFDLDVDEGKMAELYLNYCNFQRTYYGQAFGSPALTYQTFKQRPIIVLDATYQKEYLHSGQQVDVKIEFKTKTNVKENTSLVALILSDRLFTYTPLSGSVQKHT